MNEPDFLYLNVENTWPGFALDGVVRRYDGALILAPVEGTAADSGLPFPIEALAGPASIGIDGGGNLYVPDPAQHRILVWDAHSGRLFPFPAFAGKGSSPGQLQTPRGVLVARGDTLYVADSGNRRVQIVDLSSLELKGIWGQLKLWPPPISRRFREPWGLAVDEAGRFYVRTTRNAVYKSSLAMARS